MTNKTEDKFYFGKPGEPERFAKISDIEISKRGDEDERNFSAKINGKSVRGVLYKGWSRLGGWGWTANFEGIAKSPGNKMFSSMRDAIAYAAERLKFSRPGQPERFAGAKKTSNALEAKFMVVLESLSSGKNVKFRTLATSKHDAEQQARYAYGEKWEVIAVVQEFSNDGNPDEFDLSEACWEGYEPVGTKQKDGRTVPNCVPKDKNEHPEEFAAEIKIGDRVHAGLAKAGGAGFSGIVTKIEDGYAYIKSETADKYGPQTYKAPLRLVTKFSRPGSPDKFDASSLDRGNFAEASKSPMLGKLLAAKVMPDGGWRAVQVGSDTLVISFEDADLARDFGRRASTKGYSATSPVATTGRYWNVEVKNGK